jgi:hypothetical protein
VSIIGFLATIAFFGLLSVGMAFIIATAVFSDIEEKVK